MSDTNSIFDDAKPVTPVVDGAATPNANDGNALDTILSSIKNDRGEPKYKSVEDALVALRHSQEYIPTLTSQLTERDRELEDLRKTKAKQEELQTLVDRLTQSKPNDAQTSTGFDENKIAELVDQRLKASKQAQTSTENRGMVEAALRSKFGDEKIAEVVRIKAEEMGLSPKEMSDLAARSPKAVLTMFGVSGEAAFKQANKPPADSSVNAHTFQAPPGTLIGRETFQLPLGATHQHMQVLQENASKMVDELHSRGMTVDDLTDPRLFFKIMK